MLKEVFDDADVDGSGEIDLAELRKALNKTNLGNAAEDMFKAIDKDGSKKIGFDEYLKVRSPAPRPSPRTSSPHPRRRFPPQPRRPLSHSSLRLFRLPPQAYYRFATPQEIRDIMLWVYPPKVEKAAEVKRLTAQRAEIKSIFVLSTPTTTGSSTRKNWSRRCPRRGTTTRRSRTCSKSSTRTGTARSISKSSSPCSRRRISTKVSPAKLTNVRRRLGADCNARRSANWSRSRRERLVVYVAARALVMYSIARNRATTGLRAACESRRGCRSDGASHHLSCRFPRAHTIPNPESPPPERFLCPHAE